MNAASKSSLWNRLTVGQKLALIPTLFILAIAGILLYTVITAQDQKMDAYVIFMASRQRMLTQRQALEATLTSQGLNWNTGVVATDDKEAKMSTLRNSDYSATRKLLIESCDALMTGGQVIDLFTGELRVLPPAQTAEIRAKLAEQKSLIASYSEIIDKFVKFKPSDAEYRPAMFDVLEANYKLEMNCIVVAKLLADNSLGKISTMISQETVLSAVVALLGILFSWIVTRGIVTPLGSVVQRAQDIGAGNLKGQKLVNPSDDEIGQLTVAFNQMMESLRDLAGQTVSVTENLNAAASEILASTQEQATGTKEQAATIQEINTTMEEVRQSGAQITEKAKNVATAAEATSTTTMSGLTAVQDTNRTMEAIREQVEEVAENIVALSEKTQAVSEIIATVNDIAERSNLLALNAAIEAAAAGEQGNRFSVVANEIKNLADQAKESTIQVRTILGDIQKGSNSTVMLTEEAVKRADLGKQQADITEQTIRRMADTTQESVQAFQQIIGATNQQQIGLEQVTQGMQDIRQAANQTATGTGQLEKAVANLNAQSHQLREAVGRYQL